MRYILSLYILGSFFLFGQNGITVGDIDFSYSQPKEYELGPIRVIGADNFDHQAIKLIAGLRQGQKIILPSNDISNAIKNLWNEEILKDGGDTKVLIRMKSKDKNYAFNLKTSKLIDASKCECIACSAACPSPAMMACATRM